MWDWTGFSMVALDGDVHWTVAHVDGAELPEVGLPEGLELGDGEADVRAEHEVVDESRTGGGWTVLVLEGDLYVTLDPQDRTVSAVDNRYQPPC